MPVNPGLLPNYSAPIDDQGGLATQEWRDFFLLLAAGAESAELAEEYAALADRVTALEDEGTKPILGTNGIRVITTDTEITATLVASLPNLLDVDNNLDNLAVEDDALRFNAATRQWEARAMPDAGVYLPMVTGEVYLDQPRFMYFDDGSLFSVQVE